MGPSEITVNAYVLYSMLGVMTLMMITMMGVLFRLLYLFGRMDGRLTALEKALADFRQEMAAQIIRLDNRIDQLGARIDRVEAAMLALRDQLSARIDATNSALGELRGMVMALNQKIDLLMRHRHDPVRQDVLLTPAAPEISAD